MRGFRWKILYGRTRHDFIKTKLPAFMENECERVRQEKEEKLKKVRKLRVGDPKYMTVVLLREVLLEVGVIFKASDS